MDIEMPSLYEQNQMLMDKEPALDPILFNKKVLEVSQRMASKKYWMLLCREQNNYTVFIIDDLGCPKLISEKLSITLKNRGEVLSIDLQPDGAYEIWIRMPGVEKPVVYYLFDYAFGIVEC